MTSRSCGTIALATLLLVAAGPSYGEPTIEAEFARANEEFAAGDYEASSARFRALVERGHLSAPLLYDLANAEAKAGRTGAAVLGYERALALTPGDPDILANLRQARAAANLAPPERSRWQAFAATVTVDTWTWLALGALWSACGLGMLYGLRREEGRGPGRAWGIGMAAAMIVVVTSVALGVTRTNQLSRGVILGPTPALRVAPFEAATISAELIAGQLVDIERSHQGFCLVRTDDGQAGWISSRKVETILSP